MDPDDETAEDVDDDSGNGQVNIDFEDIEEELDLHFPVVGDNIAAAAGVRIPNGFHQDNEEEDDDDSDDDFLDADDEEIPLQPRIMLGGALHRVDDSSDDDDDDNEGEEEDTREAFDRELPGRHAYLGEGVEVGGRLILDDGDLVTMPLLNQPGLKLVPGQLLPLHLFHPAVVSMIKTVIETSKTFGVVSLKADSGSWRGEVGTTAEIFEYNDGEAEDVSNSPRMVPMVGLKIKARGRQRFRLESTRRQVDGNLVGEVRMLVDRELEEPDTGARLRSWARLVTLDTGGISDSSPDTDTGASSSCFSFLSMLRPPSVSSSSAVNTFKAPQRWRRRHNARQVLTPLPSWVWDLYSPSALVARVQEELSKLSSLSPNIASLPSDPTQLSWWATANLPFQDEVRSLLLSLNCPVQRLRVTLAFLTQQCRVLVCRNCGKQLGDQHHIFSMSKEGPQGAFVNPGGHVHETLTLYRAKNLRLVGRPSTEYSWFPGYAWTITECLGCWSHIGWKFTATQSKLRPQKFYGVSRRNVETKVEVPDAQEDDEDTTEEAEKNRIIL